MPMRRKLRRTDIILQGSVIGILGDGQLGQMLALAAVMLGFTVKVIGPEGRDSPAGHASYWANVWAADALVSEELLDEFCEGLSVVLLEWENVPVELVRRIEARGIRVCCGSDVLEIAQDRIKEKTFARAHDIPTPDFRSVSCDADVSGALQCVQVPSILKTCRGGYDGQKQVPLKVGASVEKAWRKLKGVPCILETKIPFSYEISVIVAKSCSEMECYGPFVNVHRNGILHTTTYPGKVPERVQKRALLMAKVIARKLKVHGIIAIEMFVTHDDDVLFNEMAPRTHNSGHGTQWWSFTSQFEQHIRAACNWPLGSAEFHSGGVMTNIIGFNVRFWQKRLLNPRVKLHLYGKAKARRGRKMGHVVEIHPLPK